MIRRQGLEGWVSAHFVDLTGACLPQALYQTGETSAAASVEVRSDAAELSLLAHLLEDETSDSGEESNLIADDAESAVSQDDCRVTAHQIAQARMTPAGEATELISAGTTLTSLAQTENWLLVLIDGAVHWAPARDFSMNGNCRLLN